MNGPKSLRIVLASCVCLCLQFLSAAAWAQGSNGTIAGVVKDASGAVLPGVTVEAASPALIEKTRTTVADTQGLYRIVDLRPGRYVVTFKAEGFQTIRREGIELQAAFKMRSAMRIRPQPDIHRTRACILKSDRNRMGGRLSRIRDKPSYERCARNDR